MPEWLGELNHWHWLILGVVLLILEIMGASGFLVGLALASLTLAGLVAVGLIESWQFQLLAFAVLGMLLTVLYWKVFRRFNSRSDDPRLNDRAAQMIGRRLTLDSDIDNGQGRVQIGDTFWKVSADQALTAGTPVEVYDSVGMVLKIRAI